MTKRILLFLLLALAMTVVLAPSGQAQPQISEADTFRVVNTQGAPGTTIPVEFYIANNSRTLLGYNAFVRIDTSKVRFAGVVDLGVYFVDYANFNRGNDNIFSAQCNGSATMLTTDSINGTIFAIGNYDQNAGCTYMEKGSGSVGRFYLEIKPDIPLGTTTDILVFSPNDFSSDPRRCAYSDTIGITIYPTLVKGVLEIDTGTVIGPTPTNDPPSIGNIVPNVYNITTGTPVAFSVTATDPDVGQPITLRATGMPSGATFGTGGQVVGANSVTGTFSWTPNASQIGTFLVTFTCNDDSLAQATPRTVTFNVSGVVIAGDKLFSSSQPSIGPVAGGTPGLTGVNIPVNLSSTRDVYGVQFDFVYPSNVLIIDSLVPTVRLNNFTVYDNIGDTPGRVRVVAFGLQNEKVQSGPTSAILDFWVTVRGSATIGAHPIDFENSFEAISPDPFQPSVALDADTNGIFVVDPGGDVNGDGRVDIADMVIVVGYIIGTVELNLRQFTAADMDRNGFVDVVDLQAIINQVFGGTPPSPSQDWVGDEAEIALNRSALSSGGSLSVQASLPTEISGVQVELHYNVNKVRLSAASKSSMASDLNFVYKDHGDGRAVLLLYPNGTSGFMSAGTGELFEIPAEVDGVDLTAEDLKIEYAVMSDPNAVAIPVKGFSRIVLPSEFELRQNYPNPFNPETNIEFTINAAGAGKHATLTIYNLLGQPIYTMVDQALPATHYSYKWYGVNNRGEKVASGVYFYRLIVGDQAKTRKMVLLK